MMTTRQQKLVEKHGTVQEFENSIWKAYSTCYINLEEALSAIIKFKSDWKQAGIKKTA